MLHTNMRCVTYENVISPNVCYALSRAGYMVKRSGLRIYKTDSKFSVYILKLNDEIA